MSPALPTHVGQSWAQPSRSSARPRGVIACRTTGMRTTRGTALRADLDRRPATGRRDVDERLRIDDLGEELDPVDDPRSGTREVRPSHRARRRRPRRAAARSPIHGGTASAAPIRRRSRPGGTRTASGRASPDRPRRRPPRSSRATSRRRSRAGPSRRRGGSAPAPSGRRRTADRAIRGRRRGPLAGRSSRRAATRCSTAPSRSRSDSTRSIAASSTSAIAPTVVIVLRMPSIEVGSSETTVMSASIAPGDLVDLAIADRADAAQLLGEDQVGLGRRERLLVERVERRPAVHRRRDPGVDVARADGSRGRGRCA